MRPTTYDREASSFLAHAAYAHNVRMIITVTSDDLPSFALRRRVHDTIPVPRHISHICANITSVLSMTQEGSCDGSPARIYIGPFDSGMTEKSVGPSVVPVDWCPKVHETYHNRKTTSTRARLQVSALGGTLIRWTDSYVGSDSRRERKGQVRKTRAFAQLYAQRFQ